jgi:hypothetical protein
MLPLRPTTPQKEENSINRSFMTSSTFYDNTYTSLKHPNANLKKEE